MVRNLPGNAGDTGLIPGLGRSHMLRSNEACAHAATEPKYPGARALQREPHAGTPQPESSPLLAATRESLGTATKTHLSQIQKK